MSWGRMSWVGGLAVLGGCLLVEGTKPGLWAPAWVGELTYSHLDEEEQPDVTKIRSPLLDEKSQISLKGWN